MLVNLMGLFPLGSAVVLDTGELAVVYHNSNDPRMYEQPWVKVVRDARARRSSGRRSATSRSIRGRAEILRAATREEARGLDAAMTIVF